MEPKKHSEEILFDIHHGEKITGHAARMRVRKHLNDINDTITDDDIRNIPIGIPEQMLTPSEQSRYNRTGSDAWNVL